MKKTNIVLLVFAEILALLALLAGCSSGTAAETMAANTDSPDTTGAAETQKSGTQETKPAYSETTQIQEEDNEEMASSIILSLNYTISAEGGSYTAKSSRFATESYLSLKEFDSVTISDTYRMTWIAYDDNYGYLGNTAKFLGSSRKWLNSGESITADSVTRACPNASYIRIAVCSALYTSAFTMKDITDSAFTITPKAGSKIALVLPTMPEYTYKNQVSGEDCTLSSTYIGTTEKYQDGAVYGNILIRLSSKGAYKIYSLENGVKQLASGTLDGVSCLAPHSNSVFFGTKKYSENDEFPLLYCNIYNNYQKESDRKEGICCVYRLTKDAAGYKTELVQLLKIGFASEKGLWLSKNASDVRPYGNFVCDPVSGTLYAFVPVDESRVTRIFAFMLPDADKYTEYTNVGGKQINTVVLSKTDIIDSFEYAYSSYPQGATIYNGILYSLEGFNHVSGTRAEPGFKMIDLASKKLIADIPLYECGLTLEPEMISFNQKYGIIYSDSSGVLYSIDIRKQ